MQNDFLTYQILFILFNICIGTEYQKQKILSEKGLFDLFLQMTTHENSKIKNEAIWCLSGFTNSENIEVINFIIQNNILKYYKAILGNPESGV